MSLLGKLKQFAAHRMMKTDALFSYPITLQRQCIDKLGSPRSDLERSYFQYKCQMRRMSRMDIVLQNMASAVLVWIYLCRIRGININNEDKTTDAIFFQNSLPDSIIPLSLQNEYRSIHYCNYEDTLRLTTEDKKMLLSILGKYPLHPFFCFKILIRVASYRAQIMVHSPKAIIVSSEYSFTSSFLTYFLEKQGIEHINVMHGEKLYTISDAFFRFSRCYVWDRHYVELFNSLKAYEKQYIIEVPPSQKFENKKAEKTHYLKYYLAGEREQDLKTIAYLLGLLQERGFRVAVRPHPRFSDTNLINSLFSGIEIEPLDINIEQSLSSCEYVAALFSTVLNQAYYNGIKIVIDDYTNPEKYNKLKDMQYLIMSKEHFLMSEIIT